MMCLLLTILDYKLMKSQVAFKCKFAAPFVCTTQLGVAKCIKFDAESLELGTQGWIASPPAVVLEQHELFLIYLFILREFTPMFNKG